jgi:hypothetical protein
VESVDDDDVVAIFACLPTSNRRVRVGKGRLDRLKDQVDRTIPSRTEAFVLNS